MKYHTAICFNIVLLLHSKGLMCNLDNAVAYLTGVFVVFYDFLFQLLHVIDHFMKVQEVV